MKLLNGDCLELMKELPSGSVDLVLTDPPYGTTACKWDSVIPFEPMWEQLKRVICKSGQIVLFGSQPFTTHLISSNLKWFRYTWVWEKEQGSNFLLSNQMPMKIHEDIIVFSKPADDIGRHEELREYFYSEKIKGGFTNKQINELLGYSTKGSGMAGHYFKKDKQQFCVPKKEDYEKLQKTGYFQKPYCEIMDLYNSQSAQERVYNPQMTKGKPYISGQGSVGEVYGGKKEKVVTENYGTRYPTSIIKFNREVGLHPTQKPIALLEYLIKTYTNEGETVLDFTMGSGSTGLACINTNRDFIGIELDENYFNIAKKRIEEAKECQTQKH